LVKGPTGAQGPNRSLREDTGDTEPQEPRDQLVPKVQQELREHTGDTLEPQEIQEDTGDTASHREQPCAKGDTGDTGAHGSLGSNRAQRR